MLQSTECHLPPKDVCDPFAATQELQASPLWETRVCGGGSNSVELLHGRDCTLKAEVVVVWIEIASQAQKILSVKCVHIAQAKPFSLQVRKGEKQGSELQFIPFPCKEHDLKRQYSSCH